MRQDGVQAGARHVVESYPAFTAGSIFSAGFDGAQCSRNIDPPYRINADING
jgi:hypothetical protein